MHLNLLGQQTIKMKEFRMITFKNEVYITPAPVTKIYGYFTGTPFKMLL